MIEFWIDGIPAPQGSKSAVTIGGKARLIEGSSTTGRNKHKAWRKVVTDTARLYTPSEPLNCPLAVEIDFVLPQIKSSKSDLHVVKPDLDKLIRSTFDAITDARIWQDDSRVTKLTSTKRRGTTPGAYIRIEEA
jgi:Holliday junction resolvase RusA-like endonuclease